MLGLKATRVFVSAGSPPLIDAGVLLDDGRIMEVGRDAAERADRIVDYSGCSILAGFWNAHVHFFERKWSSAATLPAPELSGELDAFLQHGFTTVVDLGSPLENTLALRYRIETGEVRGPRILTCGEGLLPPNGTVPKELNAALGIAPTTMPEVRTVSEARTAVDAVLARGADCIKLFCSAAPSRGGERMPIAAMTAAVERAHDRGRTVFAHPNTMEDAVAALQSGVDVLAHTVPNAGTWANAALSPQFVHTALIPTFTVWNDLFRHDRRSVRERILSGCAQQVQQWRKHGRDVLFGTDYGAVAADVQAEIEHMRAAGLTFEPILRSLTTAPARRLSSTRGTVEPGEPADLVIVDGNPLDDISALTRVRATFVQGTAVTSDER